MDNIKTWQQGYFVDQRQYDKWSKEKKQQAKESERHLVRPSPTGNAICRCNDPEDAKWIARRLNLAVKLEKKIKTIESALRITEGTL